MKLNEIIAPTMKELFVHQLESLILSGQLKIGERLPAEREMAQQMKVSKTIINLGLNELRTKGFITVIPRQGTFVADYTRQGTLDTLLSVINFNGGSLDRRTFYSLMEFRMNNETVCAALAAKNRTEADIVELENHCCLIADATDAKTAAKHVFDFHHTIFCATGNVIYPLLHNAFEGVSIKLTSLLFSYYETSGLVATMKQFIGHIRSKNAEAACTSMKELLSVGIDNLKRNYFKEIEPKA